MNCEFPLHSSLWANITHEHAGINLQSIALRNDLALLPAPFFDQRDNRLLKPAFRICRKAILNSLRARAVSPPGLVHWRAIAAPVFRPI